MASNALDKQRIAFIQSEWHSEIVESCRTGFLDELAGAGVDRSSIEVFDVTGSFEIPLQAMRLAETGNYAVIVAAGFVVNGGIYRHEFVASAVIDGLMRVQLDSGVPVISAVLTPRDFHDHPTHVDFFTQHMSTKGQEAAHACRRTVERLQAPATA